MKSYSYFSLEFVKNNFISRLVESLIYCYLSGERKTIYLVCKGLEGSLSFMVCLTAHSQQKEAMKRLTWCGLAEIRREIWCLLGSTGKRCRE